MSEENKSKKDLGESAKKKADEIKKEVKDTAKEVKETISEKVDEISETDAAHQEAEVQGPEESLWDSIREITVKQALLILGGFALVGILLQGLYNDPGKKRAHRHHHHEEAKVADAHKMSKSTKRLLSNADEKVSNVAKGTAETAKEAVKGTGNVLGNLASKAEGALAGAAGAVKDGATGIVEGTKKAVEGTAEVVKESASALAEGTKEAFEGTKEGVENAAAAVTETTSEVVEETKEALIVKKDNAKGVAGSWTESAKRDKIRGKRKNIFEKRASSAEQKRAKLRPTVKADSKEVPAEQNVEVEAEESAPDSGQDISSMAASSSQLAKDIEAKKAVISELQSEVNAMEAKIEGLKGFIGSADSETTKTIKEQIVLWKGLLDEKEKDLKEAEGDL